MNVRRRRARLWLLIGIPLVVVALGVGAGALGMSMARARIARFAAGLPVPIEYEHLRIGLSPLSVQFEKPAIVGYVELSEAELATVALDGSQIVPLVRSGLTRAGLLRAVQWVAVRAVEVSAVVGKTRIEGRIDTVEIRFPSQRPSADRSTPDRLTRDEAPNDTVPTGHIPNERASLMRSPFELYVTGWRAQAHLPSSAPSAGQQDLPSVAPETDEAPDPLLTDSPENDLAARLEGVFNQALSLRRVVPPVRIHLGQGALRLSGATVGIEDAGDGQDAVGMEAPVDIEGQATVLPDEPLTWAIRFEGFPVTAVLGDSADGWLRGDLEGTVNEPTAAGLSGRLETRSVSVSDPRLAEQPVGPLDIRYEFDATLDTRAPFPEPEMARRVPGTDVPAPIGAGAPEDAQLRGAVTVTRGALTVTGGARPAGAAGPVSTETGAGPTPAVTGGGATPSVTAAAVPTVTAEVRPVLVGLNAPQGDLPFPAPARLDMHFELPDTPLEDVVGVLPPAVLGPLEGLELIGSLSWDISLEAPTRRLSWTRWEETHQVTDAAIVAVDPSYDVRNLLGAFRHQIINTETGYRRTVVVPAWDGSFGGGFNGGSGSNGGVGNGSSGRPERAAGDAASVPALGGTPKNATPDPTYRYARYDEIAPAFIGAVVTAEDGEFFLHNGVNWLALTFAAEVNLTAGEIVVGGSTIPMQLAKNLFLDDDRVVVRKLQELGLVALANLDGTIPRRRVLEIYLNVIEYGTNLYGIHDAARHYFSTTPDRLSVSQAVWLASIIRNPRVLSHHAVAGRVPQYWLNRMDGIMELMVERERLTPGQLVSARDVQPEFAAPQ